MPKKVNLPDGRVFNFPDTMDEAAIQSTISDFLSKEAQGKAVNATPNQKERTTLDNILDVVRPFTEAPAVAVGMKTAQQFPGPLPVKALAGAATGGATYLGLDKLLQSIYSPQSKPEDSAKNSSDQLLWNEGAGAVIKGASKIPKVGPYLDPMNYLKGLQSLLMEKAVPGSILTGQKAFLELEPVYSQLYRQVFGKDAKVAPWIENIFASGAKAKAMENSARIGKNKGIDISASLTGRTPQGVSNPSWLGVNLKQRAEGQLARSYAESDAQANVAKTIAESNIVQIQGSLASNPQINGIAMSQVGQPFDNLNPAQQQSVLQLAQKLGIQAPVQEVKGPIQLSNAARIAQEYLDERSKFYGNLSGPGIPDPEKQIITAAQRLIELGKHPVSFKDAWDFKKLSDQFANYDGPRESRTFVDSMFGKFSKAINQDIDESIPKWQNGGQQAKQAWEFAKSTVEQRHALFGEDGLKQLINNTNSPVPAIDQILADPTKISRALAAGNLKLPSGTVKSTNMKRDLQGYQMMKWLNSAWSFDPMDVGKAGFNITEPSARGSFAAQKIVDELTDPNKQEGYKLLFNGQTRSDIVQFFKNVAATQMKRGQGSSFIGSNTLKLWMARSSILLAPSLFTGTMSRSVAGYAAPVLAIGIGGSALGRLMTNPKTARLMVAAAAGTPLPVSEAYASRVITGALQGTKIALVGPNGQKEEGTIDTNGHFQPD